MHDLEDLVHQVPVLVLHEIIQGRDLLLTPQPTFEGFVKALHLAFVLVLL